jgi:hypothetical protein
MVAVAQPPNEELLARVNDLDRVDYSHYLTQVARLPKGVKQAIYQDWRLYRRAFTWVIEKLPNGIVRPVRFEPRGWQKNYETSRTLNDIALKARKVGFSTDILLEGYAKSATMGHQRVAIMSHEEDATKRLLEIVKIAHEYNPMAPPLSVSNTQGLTMEYTKSRIWVGTAGARVFGRGDDLTLLHLSEAAHFYKKVLDVETFMAGISEAVAKGGRWVIESTPNGEDPIFFPRWQSSQSGEFWRGIFLSLFEDETTEWNEDHPLALAHTRVPIFEMSPYELALHNTGARTGHIRFMRYEKEKLSTKSEIDPSSNQVMGDERMLLQEYPTDPQTCFLSSEDVVFDSHIVQTYRHRVQPPMFWEYGRAMKIWEQPISDHRYVIFVDTSEGLPTSHDQAIVVLDVGAPGAMRRKYVATMRIKVELATLAKHTAEIGYKYNTALLMVERNNHGHVVLDRLQESGYPNLYFHSEDKNFLRSGEVRLGWPTRWQDTKPRMIDDFKEMFEAGAVEIHCTDLLTQIAQYRYHDPRTKARGIGGNQRDRYGAVSGGADDLLDAAMGALQGVDHVSSGRRAEPIHYGDRR